MNKINYLVVLNIDGTKHFEIIRNITNTTVYLFDPNLGDLEMTQDKFNELYTGVSLIINGTAPPNAALLTDDEMRNIKPLLENNNLCIFNRKIYIIVF